MQLSEIEELLNSDSLTEDERAYLDTIIEELSDSGSSEALSELWSSDYDQVPVDIRTFITDPYYLGNSFTDDEGNSLIYPYWVDTLEKVFSSDSEIYETVFSGAIGIGKSTIASIGMAYVLHKLLCLKNPSQFYRLVEGSKVAVAFFNITLDQTYGVGYQKLQDFCQASEWFLENGTVVGREYPTYVPGKDIEILVGSKREHFLGRDVFCAFMDEIEFAPGASKSMESSKIMTLYNTIKRRMESRYQRMGTLPGMLFMVSSKNSEDDFLEQYINKYKDEPYLYLVDEPLWVVKGSGDDSMYSGETFTLAIGTRNIPSTILEDTDDPDVFRRQGQKLIEVPEEHRGAFEMDVNSALADIAGIAVTSTSKFMVADKIIDSYRSYLKHPFTAEKLVIGFDDEVQIKDFLDESRLSKLNREQPHFIHWDTSKTGDMTGLGMTTLAGTKEVQRVLKGEGTLGVVEDILHKVVFGVGISPVPGDEIPFYKIREFIYYLHRELGYNIVSISCDSYQSVDTLQQFRLQGYNSEEVSVDRTTKPYVTLKNAYNEGRVIAPENRLLEDELFELEDDRSRGKIDHPSGGSKDIADTIAACVYKASTYEGAFVNRSKVPPSPDNIVGDYSGVQDDIDELLDGII